MSQQTPPRDHQAVYRLSTEKVRGDFAGEAEATAHFGRYVSFVRRYAAPGGRLLEVGCGEGWSTLELRRAGFDAVGSDLHKQALKAWASDPGLPYVAASGDRLPFAGGTFDVLTMHQVLEHVPDPPAFLGECLRVLRPGGRLLISGPHLQSWPLAVHNALRLTASGLKGRAPWRRHPELARHPFGNTPVEGWLGVARAVGSVSGKMLGVGPRFTMREPDMRPPFHGDNDACYECNPLDLVRWARRTPGVRVLGNHEGRRRYTRWAWPFGWGTWVALEKV